MDVPSFGRSPLGRLWIRAIGAAMESRFRHRFFSAEKILSGVELRAGQSVLEVGCGTGFFTLAAAERLGRLGSLTAIDVLPESVELVSRKAAAAGLENVRVIRADALDTKLPAGGFDAVLLFGVIPAPVLPLGRLLPEMRRVLKPEGVLAVWPPVPGWLPGSVVRSGLFVEAARRGGVLTFRPAVPDSLFV